MAFTVPAHLVEAMIQGPVIAVNTKGDAFRIGTDWFRLSRKATGLEIPEKGQYVTLNTDDKGYVISMVVKAPKAAAAPAPAASATNATVAQSAATGWAPSAGVKGLALTAAATLMAGTETEGLTVEHYAAECITVATLFEAYLTGNVSTAGSRVVRQAAAVASAAGADDLPF